MFSSLTTVMQCSFRRSGPLFAPPFPPKVSTRIPTRNRHRMRLGGSSKLHDLDDLPAAALERLALLGLDNDRWNAIVLGPLAIRPQRECPDPHLSTLHGNGASPPGRMQPLAPDEVGGGRMHAAVGHAEQVHDLD